MFIYIRKLFVFNEIVVISKKLLFQVYEMFSLLIFHRVFRKIYFVALLFLFLSVYRR